jgi:hypothetical protein
MSTNLSDLQSLWTAYGKKLTVQESLTEKMMRSMIRERSRSTLAVMGRKNILLASLFLFYTLFFTACILGNAFDYTHPAYYIPLVLQGISCCVFAVLLLNTYSQIKQVDPAKENLSEALQKVIRVNDRHVLLSGRIWWGYFIAGVLFPFTFLPRMIESKGTWEAIGLLAILVVVIGGLLVAAKKLQLFRDSHGDQLKENLHELEAHLQELQRA